MLVFNVQVPRSKGGDSAFGNDDVLAMEGSAAMGMDNDQSYYGRRAQRQLDIARAAADPTIKSIHLDLASRYATLSELAARADPKDGSIAMPPMQVSVGR